MLCLHWGEFMNVKWVQIPRSAALQVTNTILVLLSEVICMSFWIEPILEKNCFLIFWVPILLHPKAVTDVKNSVCCGWGKDMEFSPSPPNYSKDSWKLLLLLISNWPSLVTWWVVMFKRYIQKWFPSHVLTLIMMSQIC